MSIRVVIPPSPTDIGPSHSESCPDRFTSWPLFPSRGENQRLGGLTFKRSTIGLAEGEVWVSRAEESEDFAEKFEILLQLGESPASLKLIPSLLSLVQNLGADTQPPAGRGSYGSVYKARVKATGEFVAIKVIQLGEGDKIADIQKEISMLSECNHPNVVRYMVGGCFFYAVAAEKLKASPVQLEHACPCRAAGETRRSCGL